MSFKFNNLSTDSWDININFGIRLLAKSGLLTYEYNPLKVLRYQEDLKEVDNQGNEVINFYKNELTELDTEKFNFDLNHPVLIEAQESYDGTVNLILNDDKNIPRMINTRFSTKGNNAYEIVERTVDSNIYDYEVFDTQTSLYKRVSTIPKLNFLGIKENGNLKVGNYTFYFKLADGDGNETDWIAHSGIVSCHLGNINDPFSIRGGMEEENSFKQVEFELINLDPAYNYVTVYYLRNTSDQNLTPLQEVNKVDKLFSITNLTAIINITGFETTQLSSIEELNLQYIVVDSVKTQALCDGMLFFGNVKELEIDYEEFIDLSLRITPELTYVTIGHINQHYVDDSGLEERKKYEYYNVNNIYNYLGYWDDEFYRFGVVYILNNYTLSPVFNIRGIKELSCDTEFKQIPVYADLDYKNLKKPARNKIIRNKETYGISYKYLTEDETLSEEFIVDNNENSKGVVHINYNDYENLLLGKNKTNAIGFNFNIPEDVLYALKGQVKGLFFVRLERNRTTMCQTVPIITDLSSHLPALPTTDNTYIMESLVSAGTRYLTHNFASRARFIENSLAADTCQAAICPDYVLNQGYYNQYFTGTEFIFKRSKSKLSKEYFQQRDNHFYNVSYEPTDEEFEDLKVYITTIPDSAYLVKGRLGKNWFAAAAGEEADPLKVSYIGYDSSKEVDRPWGNTDYVTRGFYGPYLGLENSTAILPTLLYDIKIPDYNEDAFDDYIEIRCRSNFPFYAISPRISLEDIEATSITEYEGDQIEYVHSDSNYKITNIFGGDCFIGNFSFRMDRNFLNSEAPNNDIIIDGTLWGRYYRRTETAAGEHNKFICLGDIYAVRMGHYGTVKVCSNYNLAFRSTDPYYPSEYGISGHERSFYPYTPLSDLGSYKIPESFLVNAGLNKVVNGQNNIECPDVPALVSLYLTRVLYSDMAVQNSFRNGYRIFRDLHYKDYTTSNGELVALVEKAGDIFAVFEHAVGYIGINAKALLTDQAGGPVFVTTANVLSDPIILSNEFGSLWQESVLKTATCIYGVDTVAKRLWRIAVEGSLRPQYKLKTISDFKVQRFLNENVTLGEYETIPTIGIRNVKTHYNAFKGDILFTFYDDVDTIEEKVWNLCFNEALEKFVTFYSWVPSYSENIDNIFFTFDRNTSKYVAKLYTDPSVIELKAYNDNYNNSSHILSTNNYGPNGEIGYLIYDDLANYLLSDGLADNYNYFDLTETDNSINLISYKEDINSIYVLLKKVIESDYIQITYEVLDSSDSIYFNIIEDTNILCVQSEALEETEEGKLFKIPIKVTVKVNYNAVDSRNIGTSSRELYTTLVLATPNYYKNLENTKFWKHGLAGLMQTLGDIKPTHWYGKQHPFEFEFIVSDNQLFLKIFDNLQLIANKAKPESFHFEVVGESYTFADDKKNIFWRLEALKHIYLWNTGNITYDRRYESLKPELRKEWYRGYCDKSTLFPLNYERHDALNEIYDSYQHMTSLSLDYQNLTGTEIVYDKLLNEFKLATHVPARCMDLGEVVEINEETYYDLLYNSNIPVHIDEDGKYYKYINYGRRLGNCHYKEDEWYILIPPILYAEKNEDWETETGSSYPPLNLYYTPMLESLPVHRSVRVFLPEHLRELYKGQWWEFEKWSEKQTRLRDKFIRIKVRYSGEDLAIIYAIRTLYTITYS